MFLCYSTRIDITIISLQGFNLTGPDSWMFLNFLKKFRQFLYSMRSLPIEFLQIFSGSFREYYPIHINPH